MYTTLRVHIDLPIAHLQVCRPEKRNALNFTAMEELGQVVDSLENLSDLRCLVISGAGDQAFVSGGDLSELAEVRSYEAALHLSRTMGRLLRRIELLDCPVLMAINGVAVGGGCELSLAGDRRFMASEASLIFRQARLGLICGWGGMTRLERLVGRSKAFEVLLLDDEISATRALELGLVDRVVPREELMEHVLAEAQKLVSLPHLALKAVKRGLVRVSEQPFDRALDYESELFARTWSSDEHWAAVDSFFQKHST